MINFEWQVHSCKILYLLKCITFIIIIIIIRGSYMSGQWNLWNEFRSFSVFCELLGEQNAEIIQRASYMSY